MFVNYLMVGGVSMLTGIVIGLYIAMGRIKDQERAIEHYRGEAEHLAKFAGHVGKQVRELK